MEKDVKFSSSDSGLLRPEFSAARRQAAFRGRGLTRVFFPQKEKTLDILSHFSSYFRKLTLECNGTRPHESSEVAEMHSGRCRKTLNEVNTAC